MATAAHRKECVIRLLLVICVTSTQGHILDMLHVRNTDEFEVCRSAECRQASEHLLASMDQNVDPCTDFYRFACGGWIDTHPVPPTEGHRNQFDLVTEKLDSQVRGLLESTSTAQELGPISSAKATYAACMDLEAIEAEGLGPLVQLSDRLGGWPMSMRHWHEDNFNPYLLTAEMTAIMGLAPLLLTYVYLDRKNSSQSVITIDQPSLVLPRSMLVDAQTYAAQLEAYAQWIAQCAQEIAQHRHAGLAYDVIEQEAREVVMFESELAKITSGPERRRDMYRTYNPMQVSELQRWTDTACSQRSSWFDWSAFLDLVLSAVDVKVEGDERVVVKEVDFIFDLVSLVEITRPRVLANYIQWRLIKSLADDTTKRMRGFQFEFDKVFSGIKEEQPRWRDCVTKTSGGLSHAVGFKYVRSYFSDKSKRSAEAMVEDIRAAFLDRMAAADWMDADTSAVAQDKADAITQFIGYPDWYNNITALIDYYSKVKVGASHFTNVMTLKTAHIKRSFGKLHKSVDRSEWITSPDIVNAYYNPQTNSITFPAGILQPPFFHQGRIEALNYGSIGVVMGHEITHGFDDMGRQSDLHGNLAQWWTNDTVDTYVTKAKCFVDQYSSFRVPQLDKQLKTEAKMNGVITQGENIADNGGLNTAFQAYQMHVAKTGAEPRLPGLTKYTAEQLFFIGFATVWCESTTKETLLREVLTDPHSPHEFRVKGSLANSQQFADAFNCPPGAPMNPDYKCLIW